MWKCTWWEVLTLHLNARMSCWACMHSSSPDSMPVTSVGWIDAMARALELLLNSGPPGRWHCATRSERAQIGLFSLPVPETPSRAAIRPGPWTKSVADVLPLRVSPRCTTQARQQVSSPRLFNLKAAAARLLGYLVRREEVAAAAQAGGAAG